jgi:limonene-1,2-epoxide hydrolase
MTRDDHPMARAPLLLVVIAVGTTGCGGGAPPGPVARTDPAARTEPAAPARTVPGPTVDPQEEKLPQDLRLPPGVPRHSTGPADPVAAHVIRGWLRALRRGDIARAASYFAEPSKVQNATPVLTLDDQVERMAFNESFPCGAVATRIGSAGAFSVVTFRLTERVGGDCKGAAGHRAIGAIRVANRKIAEWYRLRLPTDPLPQTQPRIDPGTNEA